MLASGTSPCVHGTNLLSVLLAGVITHIPSMSFNDLVMEQFTEQSKNRNLKTKQHFRTS